MARKKSAKKKPKTAVEKPAKSKGTAASRRRKRTTITKVIKETREVRANPAPASDITNVILPGFGAYALTRVLQRIVFSLVQKRFPKFGKHAHAAAGVATFASAWFFSHKVKAIAKYHDGILVGTGIAAAHGLASAYLPRKYNWLLADCKPEDVLALPAPSGAQTALPAASDDDEYSYLEDQIERSGSRAARPVAPPRAVSNPIATTLDLAVAGQDDGATLDPDLMAELGGESLDDLYTGPFEN